MTTTKRRLSFSLVASPMSAPIPRIEADAEVAGVDAAAAVVVEAAEAAAVAADAAVRCSKRLI
jgi:hypothetical protein